MKHVAIVLALVVGATTALGNAQSASTFLAAVDAVGRLTPIAVFDGRSWWNRWPRETDSPTIPAMPVPQSIASIPDTWLPPGLKLPSDWRVLGAGRELTQTRALRIEHSEGSNIDTFVVRTTFRGDLGSAGESVAISGPGVLGRFVPPTPEEEQNILQQLAGRIADLEAAAIETWRGEGRPNTVLTRVYRLVTPERVNHVTERAKGEKDFDLLKAERAVDGRTYYQLDGEKLFWMDAQRDCMMNLSSDGIVVTSAEGKVVSERIESHAYAEYCGDRAEWSTPLATLHIGGRYLWIMQYGVEDGDDYVLVDPSTDKSIVLY